MSGTNASVLEVRRLREDDIPEVLELLGASLAGGPTGAWSRAFFDWKHRDNPFGVSPGLVALAGDTVVGVRVFLRWDLLHAGQVLKAVRAVDTATHPDFQRRGIFRTLTLDLLEQLDAEEGIDLVFNTPNADSRPGYLRMGWREVGALPVRISPVRPLRFLRGARSASGANSSGTASSVAPVGSRTPARECPLPRAADVLTTRTEEIAALLGRRAAPVGVHTPLSIDYLRWRYVRPPGLDYRAVEVRHEDRLVGLGFGRSRSRASLVEFTLDDVIVGADDLRAARQVLWAARRSGVDHVAVHAAPGTEIARVAAVAGYLRAPGAGIGLVANPRGKCPPELLDAGSWSLSLGDLEVF